MSLFSALICNSEVKILDMDICTYIYHLVYKRAMLYALFPKVIQNCSLDQEFSYAVNSSVQFILHYENIVEYGLRVHTKSINAPEEQPVVFVIRQKKGVLSWQIPFLVRRDGQNFYDRYYSVNRTLCPIENNPKSFLEGHRIQGSDVFLTISTSSEKNINFSVILYKQSEFRINGFNETIKGKMN